MSVVVYNREPRVDATPPRRVPRVGVVLHLTGEEWRYAGRAASLRVVAVRADISLWYAGEWVWCDVEELGAAGEVVQRFPALVACVAVRDDEAEGPGTAR